MFFFFRPATPPQNGEIFQNMSSHGNGGSFFFSLHIQHSALLFPLLQRAGGYADSLFCVAPGVIK